LAGFYNFGTKKTVTLPVKGVTMLKDFSFGMPKEKGKELTIKQMFSRLNTYNKVGYEQWYKIYPNFPKEEFDIIFPEYDYPPSHVLTKFLKLYLSYSEVVNALNPLSIISKIEIEGKEYVAYGLRGELTVKDVVDKMLFYETEETEMVDNSKSTFESPDKSADVETLPKKSVKSLHLPIHGLKYVGKINETTELMDKIRVLDGFENLMNVYKLTDMLILENPNT
jgi:hypothetical protein